MFRNGENGLLGNKNNNRISLGLLIGVILIILGLCSWAFSVLELKNIEYVLTVQNLPLEEQWLYSYLQWQKKLYLGVEVFAISLFILGATSVLSSKFMAPKLKGYVETKNVRWYWIILILSITLIVVFSIPENFYPLLYLRYLFGAIFILFLPGYSVIKFIFVNKNQIESQDSFYSIEKVGFILILNLTIVSITGLAVNYIIGGIGLTSITLSLMIVTILFANFALIRELQSKSEYDQ